MYFWARTIHSQSCSVLLRSLILTKKYENFQQKRPWWLKENSPGDCLVHSRMSIGFRMKKSSDDWPSLLHVSFLYKCQSQSHLVDAVFVSETNSQEKLSMEWPKEKPQSHILLCCLKYLCWKIEKRKDRSTNGRTWILHPWNANVPLKKKVLPNNLPKVPVTPWIFFVFHGELIVSLFPQAMDGILDLHQSPKIMSHLHWTWVVAPAPFTSLLHPAALYPSHKRKNINLTTATTETMCVWLASTTRSHGGTTVLLPTNKPTTVWCSIGWATGVGLLKIYLRQ